MTSIAPPPGAHPLADPRVLVGRWDLRRTVRDERAGRGGRVDGTLVVSPWEGPRDLSAYGEGAAGLAAVWDGATGLAVSGPLAASGIGLRWEERGTLTWGAVARPVSRTYLLVASGRGWDVCFDDGRSFHPWRPGEKVQHACGMDIYSGHVDGDSREVSIRWDVLGPVKHQVLQTRLCPHPMHGW